jgi:hypothetical protein
MMFGCSAGYHLQRAQHHLDVAKKKDPTITHIRKDSVREVFITEPKETEFLFVDVPGDTVYLERDKIKIKYKSGKTIYDTTYLDVYCPPDTVVVHHTTTSEVSEVPCTYKELIKNWFNVGNFGFYMVHVIAGIFVLAGVGLLLYLKGIIRL